MTINEAAKAIEDAGFAFETDVPELFRDALTVNTQSPAAGEQVPAGTTISANFAG